MQWETGNNRKITTPKQQREALLFLTPFCPLTYSCLSLMFFVKHSAAGKEWIDACIGINVFVCELHFEIQIHTHTHENTGCIKSQQKISHRLKIS